MTEDNTTIDSFEENNEMEYDDEIKMEIILDSKDCFDNFIDQNENQESENMIKDESNLKEDEITKNGNKELIETPQNE